MKKMICFLVIISAMIALSGCTSKEEQEYQEIAAYYQNKLSNDEHEIKLKIYQHSDDNTKFFIEEYNPKYTYTSYSFWKREEKEKDGNIDQTTHNDNYRKFHNEGTLVYETTIDYDNQETEELEESR